MIGHSSVVAMRLRRKKPRRVFLQVGPYPGDRWAWQSPDRRTAEGELPEVFVGDTDPLLADLRWAVGLRFVLTQCGGAAAQWWAWWDALKDAGARELLGVEPDGEVMQWQA